MEKKNNLLKIASYILIAFAAIALVVSVVNIFRTLGQVNNMDAATQAALDQAVAANAGSGVSADMAVGLVSGIAYVTLAITVAFNVLKIIIGILGIKKSEVMGSNNFFMIWGIVFLIFGVFGLAGTFSLIGFCKRIVIENYIKKQPVCKRLHSVRRMPVLQTGLFSLFHLIACGWTPVPGALREIFYAGGRFFLPVYQTEALRIPPQYPAPAGVW